MAVRLGTLLLSLSLGIVLCGEASAKTDVLRTLAGRTIRWVYRDITIGMDSTAPSRTVSAEGVRDALRSAVEV